MRFYKKSRKSKGHLGHGKIHKMAHIGFKRAKTSKRSHKM